MMWDAPPFRDGYFVGHDRRTVVQLHCVAVDDLTVELQRKINR